MPHATLPHSTPPAPDPVKRASRVRELLEHLVRFRSLSGEEKDVADWFGGWLAEAGMTTGRVDDNLHFGVGTGDDTLLLASHLDVVPPSDGHPYDPFEPTLADGRLYGRGAVDAKGCVAAMTVALLELVEAGWKPSGGRVVAAFTACEERGWPYNGLQALRPHLEPVTAAIIGEPTSRVPVTAQKGLLILRVEARGRSAHAARAHLGVNAITMAARDLVRLADFRPERLHPLLGETTVTATTIEGGTARNVVPDRCVFHLDIRSTPAYTHDELVACFRDLLECDVHVHSDRLVPTGTSHDERVVRVCVDATERKPVGSPTLSDWIFVRDIPAVKIGPGESALSHTPDEHIALDDLIAGVELYRRIILGYFAS